MQKLKTYVLTVSQNFMQGHPKAGEPTGFKEKILAGEKIHTIRGNYDHWKKIADKVNSGEAVLSVRQWSGKPYKSKQVEICQFSKIGLQGFFIDRNFVHQIDGDYSYIEIEEVATNDGLDIMDFYWWFPEPFSGAIIHFTDFRYS